jgi:hypothetical protein
MAFMHSDGALACTAADMPALLAAAPLQVPAPTPEPVDPRAGARLPDSPAVS